jgi:hypothetical protein
VEEVGRGGVQIDGPKQLLHNRVVGVLVNDYSPPGRGDLGVNIIVPFACTVSVDS